MLLQGTGSGKLEAGCDEAGRGCLAGPVFAAAVILPPDYSDAELDDSKKLSGKQRARQRERIQRSAIAWAVAMVDNTTIDKLNILNASITAMHLAIDQLVVRPELLLIDGNRFHAYPGIPHQCIIKGDSLYLSIAAASVLAKTYRDDYMLQLARDYPQYGWDSNKGYPTLEHRKAVMLHGTTPYHRKSFNMQLSLFESGNG